MKKTILLTLLFFLTFTVTAQVASRIIVTQAFPTDSASMKTFMYPDNRTIPTNQMNRWRVGWIDSLTFASTTITRSLGFIPYNSLNPSGYISNINSGMIISALGYTPYNGVTNPNSYLTLEVDPSVPSYAKGLSSFTNIKTSTDLLYKPIGYNPSWLDVTGKPVFSAVSTSGNYDDLSNKPTIPAAQVQSDWNAVSGLGVILNKPTIPSVSSKVFNNNVARTLNSNYTISSTRDASVSYSISLSVTNPLLAGASTASVFLEYSTDSGVTWITVSQAVNSSSVALAVTIALTQPSTFNLSGFVPANSLVRLRSTIAGTATVTYTRGQEVYI